MLHLKQTTLQIKLHLEKNITQLLKDLLWTVIYVIDLQDMWCQIFVQ